MWGRGAAPVPRSPRRAPQRPDSRAFDRPHPGLPHDRPRVPSPASAPEQKERRSRGGRGESDVEEAPARVQNTRGAMGDAGEAVPPRLASREPPRAPLPPTGAPGRLRGPATHQSTASPSPGRRTRALPRGPGAPGAQAPPPGGVPLGRSVAADAASPAPPLPSRHRMFLPAADPPRPAPAPGRCPPGPRRRKGGSPTGPPRPGAARARVRVGAVVGAGGAPPLPRARRRRPDRAPRPPPPQARRPRRPRPRRRGARRARPSRPSTSRRTCRWRCRTRSTGAPCRTS